MGEHPSLRVGDPVPAFSLPGDNGETISNSSLKGTKYVLYFYPKDMTPGCTTQACDFRDHHEKFQEAGFEIFGISPDPLSSHEKFRSKHDLNFPLLADTENKMAEAFNVWREKKNYGKTYTGIVRSTFVVDEEGKLSAIYDNVRAKGHVERLARELL